MQLNYSNSLLINMPKENLHKLQKVQNSAAILVWEIRKRDSATRALRESQWLDVESRIKFKVIVLVYKVVHRLRSDNFSLTFKTFNGWPRVTFCSSIHQTSKQNMARDCMSIMGLDCVMSYHATLGWMKT